MKKVTSFLLLAAGLIWLAACTKASTDFQQMDDASLAAAIVADQGRASFNPENLPAEAIAYLDENEFDTYFEDITFSRDRGYEVRLATDERVYFNLRGRRLQFRGGPLNGPCGAIDGNRVALDQLRPAVMDYINLNYPDNDILRSKMRGDKLIVLLSGHIILVFSGDGIFELDSPQWRDCRCAPADQVDIPAAVLSTIDNRLPDGEIKRVCRRGDRIIVGVQTPDGRVIFVFDANWNFLFAHR